jgi:hypothetical protein
MSLYLDVAGVTFAVELPSPAWRPALAERYAAFPGPARAAWQVAVAYDPALAVAPAPWIRHDGPVTTYRFSDHAGRIDLAARRAEISTRSEPRAAAALDRTLAYICLQALPREHDGLLLHAAGVVLDGAGHVFTGASGAGKTTVARLAAGRGEVLSDENVILRLGADGPELFSTPFWGHSTPPELISRTNRRVPLAAVYVLEHTPDFELTRLAPAQAVMALLTTEKVATERADSATAWLAVTERLVAQVPLYRLDFRPTAQLWDFLTSRRVAVM